MEWIDVINDVTELAVLRLQLAWAFRIELPPVDIEAYQLPPVYFSISYPALRARQLVHLDGV
ncbi:MAG: hypothetical protein QGG14_07710 [Planctomycetota bacterium]|nr:hypothetical protein [Planctomycetota bacterium]